MKAPITPETTLSKWPLMVLLCVKHFQGRFTTSKWVILKRSIRVYRFWISTDDW
jgi:hypothetical protein